MAKKTVATLQTGSGKNHTKVIKMTKSPKTGAYTFKEEIVTNDQVNDSFKDYSLTAKVRQNIRLFPIFGRSLFLFLIAWDYSAYFPKTRRKN